MRSNLLASKVMTIKSFFSSSSYNAESAARTLKLLERRKVSTLDVGIFKRKKKPITMVTAYDYPSAVHVDLAGFDILLVGDSLGMVELGMDTTLPVTLEDMIRHTQAVKRGANRPLVITDMPFGTCEGAPFDALKNAQRLIKVSERRRSFRLSKRWCITSYNRKEVPIV
ncbi:hypothetical protein PsorP6_011647 [Peronosclerospora sorghi]|uniref:Uncharacterized protein n=1 Tax=Peronosclerospora sorghi TaxID=230839 RepID=A0ACC0WK16_9STRA|nr:hypothetical protein PsorP6_011647 [Peronosclerospora sorghi]